MCRSIFHGQKFKFNGVEVNVTYIKEQTETSVLGVMYFLKWIDKRFIDDLWGDIQCKLIGAPSFKKKNNKNSLD